jgi:hypothetical protein
MRIHTKFIHCKYFPFGSYDAIAFYPFLIYKGDYPPESLINHERIHLFQQKELLIIGFYFLYLLFWIIYGYANNPFEREAQANQNDDKYFERRNKYEWKRYCKHI